jgi:hypothetical protein
VRRHDIGAKKNSQSWRKPYHTSSAERDNFWRGG